MAQLQATFAENLKNARKRAGLTQDALAEKVGTVGKYIGAIERGIKFPSVQLIEDLAKALGIAPYELFLDRTGATGGSPEEIINGYNRFLETELQSMLKLYGQDFLSRIANKVE